MLTGVPDPVAIFLVCFFAGCAGAATEAICIWNGRVPTFVCTTARIMVALIVFWVLARYGFNLRPLATLPVS